ncbi:mucin-22-like [Maniola hyperantus]|uniref:mucin-22-like n=1 Tax=Aphantopus hyperantus TaxID=2795564 RepID=UPI00156A051E|nr:pheromone-regulated protein PRM7 [Maniola hyperantus]
MTMKTRSFYPVLLALFAIGSVLCQNAEELPIAVETNNQFPPEYSEFDGNSEDSLSTAAEPIQTTPGSTTTDVPASSLAEEDEQVIDEGSEITAAEPTETTLEPTITDVAAESVAAESSDTTSGTTIADVPASSMSNDDKQDTKIEDSEITVTESTQTTPESTVVEVAVPAVASDSEQVSKNEGSETTTAQSTETTSGSTIADIGPPDLTIKDEQDTTYGDSETTATQPSELTLESSSADVGKLVLANDDELVTNTEDSETTTAEPTHTTSGSTTSDEVAPTMTVRTDQVNSNEGSETTVVEPTESTPESPNIVMDASKLSDVESPCPEPCICITEGDSSDYIVDCSGHGLTDLPAPIDPKTTSLKLQNNQLTVIPKGISELKHLKNLNANDNLISELESGSVSELPELVSLKLANNRFQEYPKDLENALSLDTLEELDLAGNDLKTTPDIFLNLKALRTITLPEISSELVAQICSSKETLVTICTESCSEHSFVCKDVSLHSKDSSLDATLPGMIPYLSEIIKEDTKNIDDSLANSEKEISDTPPDLSAPEISSNSRRKEPSEISPKAPETPSECKDNLPVNDFSLRTAVNNAPQENVALQSIVIDNSKESSNNETDVKVGAKTTETKSSGVDKSVIAVVVAGMVIIVAVIAIKKNWGSIRKRFSSTPRANDRSDRNANGTTVPPEEVPLQDKSPV